MGIQQVRLYTNTVSTVPTTFADVTTRFSGLDPNTVADETASATITLTDLLPGTTVFAWVEAIDEAGNSSGVQPVGSASTAPPPIPSGTFGDFVVTSQKTMTVNSFNTGTGSLATPFIGLRNLPAFLVGVPMTKGLNMNLQASFTEGGIHAYGFRGAAWQTQEPDTTLVYTGNRYDVPVDNAAIAQVVYKYFEAASFPISSQSYIWFFTKTPLERGQAILNAP